MKTWKHECKILLRRSRREVANDSFYLKHSATHDEKWQHIFKRLTRAQRNCGIPTYQEQAWVSRAFQYRRQLGNRQMICIFSTFEFKHTNIQKNQKQIPDEPETPLSVYDSSTPESDCNPNKQGAWGRTEQKSSNTKFKISMELLKKFFRTHRIQSIIFVAPVFGQ
jgi:hypothetical protein